jgi:CRP-like cAMP-binding protein
VGFRNVFASHPELGNLGPSSLDALMGKCQERGYGRRELLWGQGEGCGALFLVISGCVKLTRSACADHESLMALAGPDDVVGRCCGSTAPCDRRCSASACVRTRTVRLPAEAWGSLFRPHPEIVQAFLAALAKTNRACLDRASELACLSVESRLARLLCRLSAWSPRVGPGDPLEIPRILSQREMAEAVGATRQMVTLRLDELTRAGILARKGRQILILELAALRSRARL